MPRILISPRFWILAVVLAWIVVITLLIATQP